MVMLDGTNGYYSFRASLLAAAEGD